MQAVTINHTPLSVKEYKGKRVVTFKDIDTVHGRPDGTARKRFNQNKKHFVEGEDYYAVDQPSVIRTLGILRPQGGIPASVTLITETGYLMLVKAFRDDLAWQVQRQLVNAYFREQHHSDDITDEEILNIVNRRKTKSELTALSKYHRLQADVCLKKAGYEIAQSVLLEHVLENPMLVSIHKEDTP